MARVTKREKLIWILTNLYGWEVTDKGRIRKDTIVLQNPKFEYKAFLGRNGGFRRGKTKSSSYGVDESIVRRYIKQYEEKHQTKEG